MTEIKELAQLDVKQIVAVGAATTETLYKLEEGVGHMPDVTHTIVAIESIFGGAGLCNALAYKATGIAEEVGLVTVAGTTQNARRDEAGDMIADYLQSKKISTDFQLHPGSTEQTLIILSGLPEDPKRGFRIAQQNGTLLRNEFIVSDQVISTTKSSPIIIASSFHPDKIVTLAQRYKESKRGDVSVFVWTMNQDTARILGNATNMANLLPEGLVDMLFTSEKEIAEITKNPNAGAVLHTIPLLVVTKGKEGCLVSVKHENNRLQYAIPAFRDSVTPLNDNGAGEAHHANFLSTLLSCQTKAEILQSKDGIDNLIQTAAHIANLAALLKITQLNSLWFPSLDFQLISQRIQEGKNPAAIAEEVYRSYLQYKGSDNDQTTAYRHESENFL